MTFETFLSKVALADDTFRPLVGGSRLYARELAMVKNPILPCVNFQLLAGGELIVKLSDVQRLPFRVWAWVQGPDEGFSEALSLYTAFFTALHNERKTYLTAFGVMWETNRPTDYYDDSTDRYARVATWQANLFNL